MFNLTNMQNLLFYTLSFTLMLTSACSNQATNKSKDQSPQALLGNKIITDKPVTPTERTATPTEETATSSPSDSVPDTAPSPEAQSPTTPVTPPTQVVSACPKDNNFELCRYKELKAGTMNATHASTYICTHSQIGMHIILRANQYGELSSPNSTLACDLISYDVRSTEGITKDLATDMIITHILPTLPYAHVHETVDITNMMSDCHTTSTLVDTIICTNANDMSVTVRYTPFLLYSEVKAFSDQDTAFCTEQAEEKVRILTSNDYLCTIP